MLYIVIAMYRFYTPRPGGGQTSRVCDTKYTVYTEIKKYCQKKRIGFDYVKKALLNMVYKPAINGARREI